MRGGHALVHAAGHDLERGVGRGDQVGRGGEREGEGDGDAGQDAGAEQDDEEDDEVPVAEAGQDRSAEVDGGSNGGQGQGDGQDVAKAKLQQIEDGQDDHQAEAGGDSGGAQAIGPGEGGRGDEGLVVHVVECGADQDQQQDEGREGGQHGGGGLEPGREATRDGGKPHVGAGMQCQDGAEHGEPEEDHGGEFIAPDERLVEHEAEDDAGQEEQDFGDQGNGGNETNGGGDGSFEMPDHGVGGAGRGLESGAGDGCFEIHRTPPRTAMVPRPDKPARMALCTIWFPPRYRSGLPGLGRCGQAVIAGAHQAAALFGRRQAFLRRTARASD